PAPASYTREDVAEIHLPGAPVLLQAALRALVRAGARPAGPGEFTFRAFRNGRINLGQAEAVEDIVSASRDDERRQALDRLGDHNLGRIRAWRDRVMDVASLVEAALDFSDEDVDPDSLADLAATATELARAGIGPIRDDAVPDSGVPRVDLVGVTNAGKSSLFNALLADDAAAIVSPEASTTRASLRRDVTWAGVTLRLSDTPGFDRETGGAGGRAARRAQEGLGAGDIVCWVLDASREPDPDTLAFRDSLAGGVVIFLNKSDLPPRLGREDAAHLAEERGLAVMAIHPVSARTGEGIESARRLIGDLAGTLRRRGEWSRREVMELAGALGYCRDAAAELDGPGRLELAAEDLRLAVGAFSRALGEGYAEEALTRIFSRFCIGK
ncbi:MAG: 50S ribosome-binding GTPase, partial [Planctomycetes bacterium]|nr:50S ribosome-binding GTPase [Planctomycetota bacterium]